MDLAHQCSTNCYCIPCVLQIAQITIKFWTLFHEELSGVGHCLALQKYTDVMVSLLH